ncbi:MAG: flagellar hook-associated protein FlgL [Desulfobacula sp.]|jgi:flagellar hook-associated protein 3 FlgL|nr:flagellar hook-associated protein FlgL [Desulfobacula sp.]
MRVPNISTYVNSTYRLGTLTSDLEQANEVASTQKRINEISDDPLGLSQVLSLDNTLGSLDQISQNVALGKSWIRSVEIALDSVNDLMLEVKTDMIRLANDSTTEDERKDSIERVESVIQQIVTLGNTQINGNYIFSGTDTDIIPLEYDTASGQVIYKGNEVPFEIRTDESLGVEVGRTGSNTFWDTEVHINSTNNTITFKEDNGHGEASEKILHAVMPDGLYTKPEIETAVRNALNDVSAQQGYGITYVVGYDDESQTYLIQEDGTYNGYIRTEFMWETGTEAYIHDILASDSIQSEDIDISILNKSALTIDTKTGEYGPEPLRLTWNQADEKWLVNNNPGYAMPFEFSGTSSGVDIALNDDGFTDISIKLETPAQDGAYIEFEIASARDDTSTGHEIGFNDRNLIYAPPVSDIQASYITALTIGTAGNNTINFEEINSTGGVQTLTANFNTSAAAVTYTDMDALAAAIESAMETASAAGTNSIDYAVSYDPVDSRFTIGENGSSLNELTLQWSSSTGSADTLGYYPMDDVLTALNTSAQSDEKVVNLVIDGTNNKIDFMEITSDNPDKEPGRLTASIDQKTYTSHFELALEVEEALEAESWQKGNSIDYSVSWDDYTQKFSIKENGTMLSEFHLMWQTGDNAPLAQGGTGESIGSILGFNGDQDDIAKPLESSRAVEWGIFDTLIDLKQYLLENDRDGIDRSIGRLEINYDNMTSRIVDAGMKYSRLEVRETITTNVSFAIIERRSMIEDADMIKSIMDLKNIETAYQAALSSTSQVLGLSLVDYLR